MAAEWLACAGYRCLSEAVTDAIRNEPEREKQQRENAGLSDLLSFFPCFGRTLLDRRQYISPPKGAPGGRLHIIFRGDRLDRVQIAILERLMCQQAFQAGTLPQDLPYFP